MKKIFVIFAALFLAVVTVFGVAGCNESMQNDLQGKIDELQSQIGAQQSQIEEMEDRLAEMEDQIRDRDEKIEQLENELAKMNYSVAYEGLSHEFPKDRKEFVGICNSYNDLIELCANNNYGFYDEENPDYESTMGKKVREYTEEFFNSKSLVVCAFSEPSYSGMLKVLSLDVADNILTVIIKQPFTGAAYNVVCYWEFIIEVDKSIVSGVTSSTYLVVLI